MKYISVCKALYAYEAQTEEEMSFPEDAVLYLIEKEDTEWWKAQLKMPDPGETGPVGLVPANYLAEAEPIGTVQAQFAYEARQPEELSFEEGAEMLLYEKDDSDWYLVKLGDELGLAPSNYVNEVDAVNGVEVTQDEPMSYEDEAAEPTTPISGKQKQLSLFAALSNASNNAEPYVDPLKIYAAEVERRTRTEGSSPTPSGGDENRSWAVHELDDKKKKKKNGKGNLGIGNGMLFYASETDKASPVKQWDIIDVTKCVQDPKEKRNVHLEISGSKPAIFDFQLSHKDQAKAIVTKIADSLTSANLPKLKTIDSASQPRVSLSASSYPSGPTTPAEEEPEPEYEPEPEPEYEPEPEPETEPEPFEDAPPCDPRWGVVLYPFEGQTEDELTVGELEQVLIIDYVTDEEWWRVEHQDGRIGVFQEDYDNALREEEEERQRQEEERLRQEEEELQRQQAEQEEQFAAEEAARQAEEEERWRQEQLEEEERSKRRERQETERKREAERRRKQQDEQRQREMEARAAKARAAAAPSQSDRPRNQTPAPPPPTRPAQKASTKMEPGKPDISKVRTWTDRTGAFKVEAQFLSYKDGKLRLHKLNGVKIDVPVEKMSDEDLAYVEQVTGFKILEDSADNMPLAQLAVSNASASRTAARSKAASKATKKVNMDWDWFDWFLRCKIPLDDVLHYSTSFTNERLDDSDISSLTAQQMLSLGVKEKHLERIQRYIAGGEPLHSSDEDENGKPISKGKRNVSFGVTSVLGEDSRQRQIEEDERIARELQEKENAMAGKAPNIFKGTGRKVTRPTPSNAAPKDIDDVFILQAKDQLTPKPISPTPAKATSSPAKLASSGSGFDGFDDEAWLPRSSPATPAAKPPVSLSPLLKPTPAPVVRAVPAQTAPPPPPPPPPLPVVAPSNFSATMNPLTPTPTPVSPAQQTPPPPRQRPISPMKAQTPSSVAAASLGQWSTPSSTMTPPVASSVTPLSPQPPSSVAAASLGQWSTPSSTMTPPPIAPSVAPLSPQPPVVQTPPLSLTSQSIQQQQLQLSQQQLALTQQQLQLTQAQLSQPQLPQLTGVSQLPQLTGASLMSQSPSFQQLPQTTLQPQSTQQFSQPQPQPQTFRSQPPSQQPQLTATTVPIATLLPPPLIPTSTVTNQFIPTHPPQQQFQSQLTGLNNGGGLNAGMNTGFNNSLGANLNQNLIQRSSSVGSLPNSGVNPNITGVNNLSTGAGRSWTNATPQNPFGATATVVTTPNFSSPSFPSTSVSSFGASPQSNLQQQSLFVRPTPPIQHQLTGFNNGGISNFSSGFGGTPIQRSYSGPNNIGLSSGDRYDVFKTADPNAPSVFNQPRQQGSSFAAQQQTGFAGQQQTGFVGQQPTGFGQPQMGFAGQQQTGFVGQQPTGFSQFQQQQQQQQFGAGVNNNLGGFNSNPGFGRPNNLNTGFGAQNQQGYNGQW